MTVKEKMTAPIASVGADVEQPLQNFKTNQSIADLPGKGNLQATNNAENTAKSANKKNPDDLETVSMMELYDTAYPPKLPIIDGLLYNGTYLFVGSPKIGKSFFMAQIGYHISKGLPLWGFSVRQGTVLYLALEDDYARLQKRLSQMFGMEGSENFYFATKSKSLNDGLERQLVTFVTEHKDARLIIIDTSYEDTLFSEEAILAVESAVFMKNVKNVDMPYIKCLIRDKEIKLTPEEAIRQLYIYKLIHEYDYPISRIQLETPIHFGREVKRADITIMDKDRPLVPYIIVELKKPKLTDGKEQLKSYCNATGAPIGVWTNGEQVSCYNRKDPNFFEMISDIPKASQKLSDILNEKYTYDDLRSK